MVFYFEWIEPAKCLIKEDRCDLLEAVFSYAKDGTLPSLPTMPMTAFLFIKNYIDRMNNRRRYRHGKK